MEKKYEILNTYDNEGSYTIKILKGKFKNLLFVLNNIGCDGKKLYYNYNILNSSLFNIKKSKINYKIKDIINDIYFKDKK